MTRAGGGRVELLIGREKQVGAHAPADAAGIGEETGGRRASWTRIGRLRRAAADVGSGSDKVGFVPAIVARTRAGEEDDGVGIVRIGVGRATPVSAAKRLHVFPGSDRDHVLGRARVRNGVGVVARRKNNHHLLIAGGGIERTGGLGVAHQSVVLLGIQIVVSIVGAAAAPTVIGNARAKVISL